MKNVRYNKILVNLILCIVFESGYSSEISSSKNDRTGTNPINFKHEFRVYNEYFLLQDPSHNQRNKTFLDIRIPFSDKQSQFRTRVRYATIKQNTNGTNINDDGLGDTDFRFLVIPTHESQNNNIIALGIETFLPTADKNTLGSRRLSFGPQIFFVKLNTFNLPELLIYTSYQQKFSVYENKGNSPINEGIAELYIRWKSENNQWIIFNPQGTIDFKYQKHRGVADLEFGTMLDNYFNQKGHSLYLRPSIGIGKYKDANGSIELGYKTVW